MRNAIASDNHGAISHGRRSVGGFAWLQRPITTFHLGYHSVARVIGGCSDVVHFYVVSIGWTSGGTIGYVLVTLQ